MSTDDQRGVNFNKRETHTSSNQDHTNSTHCWSTLEGHFRGQMMRSEIRTPTWSYLEERNGLRRNSNYVQAPNLRRNLHRDLAPSSSSGRLANSHTLRSAERELRRRDEEIAYLTSQFRAMTKNMSRRDEHTGGMSLDHGKNVKYRDSRSGDTPPAHVKESYTCSTGHCAKQRGGQHCRRSQTPPNKVQVDAGQQYKDWKKCLNKKLDDRKQQLQGRTAQDVINRALDQIASTPFTEEIESRQPLQKFTPPKFIFYDGKANPVGHLRHYK